MGSGRTVKDLWGRLYPRLIEVLAVAHESENHITLLGNSGQRCGRNVISSVADGLPADERSSSVEVMVSECHQCYW
ncbi:hypothetical protein GWI33_009391 [Rhynchophorus ferrugineus]|uniref:Uncharacterized protein n=1 Tax=Rhynchophorus ferrugineus TaxID=354439 RepID=A0A834I9R3_RHYFE|nr:hypothetical protein GWI33_009391 [Rhynchophorus ferrugineus]